MRIRHFLLFCLASVVVLLCGCRGSGSATLPYRERSFRAEIRGDLNGVAVTAILEQAYDADGARTITLTYSAPAALEGVTVTHQSGEIKFSRGDLHPALGADAVGDLCEPIAILLLREFEVASVQKRESETVLGLLGESGITLDQNGDPVRFFSPCCEMFTVWWETKGDSAP